MKRKSHSSRDKTLLNWHVVIFVVSMVGLWLTIPSMTYYPEPSIPGVLVNFKQHTVNLFNITILWCSLLIIHFGLYRISQTTRTSGEKMKRQPRDIKADEEEYETPERLRINEKNEVISDLDRGQSAIRAIRKEKAL